MPTYTIRSKAYGKRLIGRQVFYRGFPKKPGFLKAKGQGFPGGKHLIETLDAKFKKYKLILTPRRDEIRRAGRRLEIFISENTLSRFNSIMFEKGREAKLDAMNIVLRRAFPSQFQRTDQVETYRRGMLTRVLTHTLDPRLLSMDDVRALTSFASKVASESKAIGFDEREAVKRKRDVQLLHLKRLVTEFEGRLTKRLGENEWQAYFAEKILYFQDNYIRKIEKLNVATATTQFPDFGVVTADDYLDLIEIKLPSTTILNEDKSHNSFYWSSDISKAIAQVETYIDSVTNRKADLTLQIEKTTGLKLRIVKPRGIIIAGTTEQFTGNTTKSDYFRMLNEGLKNIEIVAYDELSRRLRNTITSIERLEKNSKPASRRRRKSKRGARRPKR